MLVNEVTPMTPQPADAVLVKLTNVGKVFSTDEIETHALSRVQLTIERGEYVAIAGPSGCGKSTLLSILGLLERPSSGDYYLDGNDIRNLDRAQRAHIRNRYLGFVFQAFNLIGDMTVYENVELPLTYREKTESRRREAVEEALERVGMSHRQKHYPAQLSGGQQQRVAVARAVTGKPVLLLADEPTGNLDSTNSESVMSLLSQFHSQGTTVCIVTHDPRFAAHATRTIRLFDGNIVDEKLAHSGPI